MNIANNKIYSEIHLDVYSNDIKVVNAQQGDKKSRFIKIYVTAMNEPVEFKNDISAVLKGHRADGEMIFDDCQIIDNYILVELKDYILCVSGECEFNIGLYGSDDSLLSTITFKVFVDKNPYDENVIISSPTFSALTEALNKVNKALKEAEEAINKINDKINEVTGLENTITKIQTDLQGKAPLIHTHDVSEVEHARSDNVQITENDLDEELIEKINSSASNCDLDFIPGGDVIEGDPPVIDPSIISYIATELQKINKIIPHYTAGNNISFKITEDNSISINLNPLAAKDILYDNSISHLISTNLAAVIDEIVTTTSKKSELFTYTLEVDNWSLEAPYYYTIENVKFTSIKALEVFAKDATLEQITAYQKASINFIEHTNGAIKLYANGEKPTIDLPIGIILRGDI